eukprot:scaffold2487_cov98-Skeletonema_dohrnii-CCMP3373.AAC.11
MKLIIAIPLLAALFGGADVAAALADSTVVLGSSAGTATENEPIDVASPTHNYDNLNLRGSMLSMNTKSGRIAKVDRRMMCTCSPQIFNIKITLTSTDPCTIDDLKPNNGIENTLCLYTNPTEELEEVKPSYYQPPAAAVHQSTLDAWTSIPPNDVFFNEHPELKLYQEEIYRMKHGLPSSSSTVASLTTPSLQVQGGLMPTQLTSAQFLEMDTSSNMQIINQDDQYLNVTFPYPSNIVLTFSSISNLLNPAIPLGDQMEYVPGGTFLILVGATASGEIVRNRMMWTYTMGCGLEDYTVLDGDVIGWAGFENLLPAPEEFCPSSGNLPPPATPSPSAAAAPTSTPSTSAPTTKPPTKTPSSKSSKYPKTKKPSMSMGSGDILDHFDLSGESKKKQKKRGELDTMKEDFRTLRKRETVMEFGRPLQ